MSQAEILLGSPGKLISSSKSIYSYDNPHHMILYNANLFVKDKAGYKKLWYGDLDLTLEHEVLKKLSKILDKELLVFYESDGRFEKETAPNLDNVVATIKDNVLLLRDTEYYYLRKGIPYRLTDEEIQKKFPTKPSYTSYEESEFEPYKLPDLTSLGKSGHILSKLQSAFVKKHGVRKATELYRNLYISQEDDQLIDQALERECLKQHPGLHPVKVEQSVAMESLDMGPSVFNGTPSWAKPGHGYIRKKHE